MNSYSAFVPPPGCYTVFGATGLAGSHALLRLKDAAGVKVRAVANRRSRRVSASNIEYVRADARDASQLADLVADSDYVLMLAGILATSPVLKRDPVGPVFDNLRIAVNCLEAAYRAGARKFIWLSSTTGYPESEQSLAEERMFEGEPPTGWGGIGWTTRYLEKMSRLFAEEFPRKMTVVALRPTMMYGEFDHFDDDTAHFLPALIRRVVMREAPIEVWGDGTQERDVIYAGDVADAMISALMRVDGFANFNIAAGATYSVNEVLAQIVRIDGYLDAPIVHLDSKTVGASQRSFSNNKAKAMLDLPAPTSLSEGLERTIRWYRGAYVR